ncbi:hypothetical protein GcM3_169025, partial [Golovinomyces cichoracearum]
MDSGDGRDVLDDDSVDDNTHTAGSRPSSEKNEHLKSSDPLNEAKCHEPMRRKK